MDRYQQEERRSERPRFRGELMEQRPGQPVSRRMAGQAAGQPVSRRAAGQAAGQPVSRSVTGQAASQTVNNRPENQTVRQPEENSRPRFRGESQYTGSRSTSGQPLRTGQTARTGRPTYRPERPAGNSAPYNREARARAMARRRKKRRQQQMLLITAVIALFLLIGGIVFGVFRWQDQKERKEFAEAGVAAAAAGNYEEAIAAFDSALKPGGRIGKFETNVLLNRAEAEYRQGSYDKALETYRLLLEDDKDNELFQEGIVLCLIEQGAYEEALSMEMLQSQVYNRMAVDQIEAGQYEEALATIALGRGFPDSSAAQDLSFNEAVAYEKMGDYAKALELFEAYGAQYGEDERAQRELAFLRTRQGNNGQ